MSRMNNNENEKNYNAWRLRTSVVISSDVTQCSFNKCTAKQMSLIVDLNVANVLAHLGPYSQNLKAKSSS